MLRDSAIESGGDDRLALMFEQAPSVLGLLEGPDHRVVLANPAFMKLAGQRALLGRPLREAFAGFDSDALIELLDKAIESNEPFTTQPMDMPITNTAGAVETTQVAFTFQPLLGRNDRPAGVLIEGHDVTEHQRADRLRAALTDVLEMAVTDRPLEESLTELIRIVEAHSRTGVLGSILLLDDDGKQLHTGAAPSLPELYSAAIDGAEIGPKAGSCGTAAYRAQPVVVADIASDPLWEDFRDLALSCGLRACWSTPIITSGRKVLGTFAMYHRAPREPMVRDLALVELVTQTAALIIDRKRAEPLLKAGN